MIAEYADTIGASTIVVGAPSHGGLTALMDASASRELWRHARSNILVVNPDAPGGLVAADGQLELAGDGRGSARSGVVEDEAEGVPVS